MDDLGSVLGAARSDRAAIVGSIAGGYRAMLYAASFPERVSSLILVDAYPRGERSTGYPCGLAREVLTGNLVVLEDRWGEGVLLDFLGPGWRQTESCGANGPAHERNSASPRSAAAMVRMMYG